MPRAADAAQEDQLIEQHEHVGPRVALLHGRLSAAAHVDPRLDLVSAELMGELAHDAAA
jgi:hypothetical protein